MCGLLQAFIFMSFYMKFRERYHFDSKKDFVGKGGFAKVYRAFDTIRKREVALKFYNGTASAKYDIISEINRMDDMIHPNLIRYYDADIISSINAIGEKEQIQVGIMEYANAGDISTLYQQSAPPMSVTKVIIKGILEGLSYLHDKGIIHRDLKPKNILLHKTKEGKIVTKIADFGISKRVSNIQQHDMSSQILGSVEYMAPEQFAGGVYGIDGKLGTNLDLWSLGIIIYEMFSKQLPFGSRTGGVNYEEILNNILFHDFEIDYSKIPEPFRSIVGRCLVKKAAQRALNAKELLHILETGTPPPSPTPAPSNAATNVSARRGKTAVFGEDDLNPPPTPEKIDQTIDTKVLPKNKAEYYEPKKNKEHYEPHRFDINKEPLPPPKFEEYVPPPPPKYYASNATILHEINMGKNLFKIGNYVESFKVLYKYQKSDDFDTEARFYLGYMFYNGKCGGAHDEELGRQMMNEAKQSDRQLVMNLMLKYILNK